MPLPAVGDEKLELLRDKVARVIRDSIAVKALQPGEQLVEAAVARQLKVSRAAVREAFWVLEKQGYVQVVPRHGAFVRALSFEEIEEIFDLRLALEPVAAVRAGRNMQASDAEELRQILADMQNCVESANAQAYYESDLRFHQKIWALSGHRKLQDVLNSACPILFTVLQLTGPNIQEKLEIHRDMLTALQLERGAPLELRFRDSIARLAGITRRNFAS
jgi:DNA-binding GntR family transcriptional regulator